jgi:leucyl-tRNA synthetase
VARAVARAVHDATQLTERYRFNVVVARLMELTSALRRAVDTGPGPADPAVRAGAEALAIMLSLFAPYCAEDCWSVLGHDVPGGDTVSRAAWPTGDETLLVEESVICVIQIDGRVRDRIEVPVSIQENDLRALALATAAATTALDGRAPRTVIVRPPRLVNVVLP